MTRLSARFCTIKRSMSCCLSRNRITTSGCLLSGTQLVAEPQPQSRTQLSELPTIQLPVRVVCWTQPQASTQQVEHPESAWGKQCRRISFDLKSWAAEQKKKQQLLQGQLTSNMRHSLEIQAEHRNRILDLTRAVMKNVRLTLTLSVCPRKKSCIMPHQQVHSFICSFVRSFIHSCIHSFIH